ncbi:HAMP domain-containing protein [Kitasatospora sp. NPDC088391]|uniref:HAMP domain-containing protein n=1 Tax=Kitasatospora sp. NPDC088391 TaxID=3364074 RepID=UPI00382B32FF
MSAPSPPRQHRYRRRADMPLLGGIRPPIVLLLILLTAVSAVTALAVGGLRVDETPLAVREAHQYTAEDTASVLHSRVRESVADLGRAAARYDDEPGEPAAVVASLGRAYQKWRGLVLVRPADGRLLAARGETVPLAGLDLGTITDTAPAPIVVPSANGNRLLTFALVSTTADGASGGTKNTATGTPTGGGTGSTAGTGGTATGGAADGRAGGKALLIASDTLRLSGTSARKDQTVEVLDRSGAVLDSTGTPLTAAGDKQIVALAVHRAAGRPAPGAVVSGHLDGPSETAGARRLVGYASLTSADDRDPVNALGLTVVSTSTATGKPGTLRHPALGFAAAGALLLLALLLLRFLLRTVQRPLLRLYGEARRLDRGELDAPVSGPTRGEAGRIARALEEVRLQLRDPSRPAPPRPPRRRRPGLALPLGLCAALILGWCVPLMTLGGDRTTARVPDQVLEGQRDRTDDTADRVRQALNESRADLRAAAPAVAAALDAGQTARATALLRATLDSHERYRSLYVLDAQGRALAVAGEAPHRTGPEAVGPGGVLLLNSSGKEPRVAARVRLDGADESADDPAAPAAPAGTSASPAPGAPAAGAAASPSPAATAHPSAGPSAHPSATAGATPNATAGAATGPANGTASGTAADASAGPAGPLLVGELRSDVLTGLLSRNGLGRVWLVDDRRRVIAANEAFVSFGDLPDGRAAKLVDRADKKGVGDVVRDGGDPVVLAAAPLAAAGNLRALNWSVVTAHPVSWLHLDQNRADRRAVLSGMLGLTAAALCLGWLFIVVGLPLRRLADGAEALAAGDRRTVLYPVHHDEVGAVARSLELLRQDLEYAARRPAGPAPSSPSPVSAPAPTGARAGHGH